MIRFSTSVSGLSLFRLPSRQPQTSPAFDFLYTLAFAVFCLSFALVFGFIQWHNRSLVLHSITLTNNSVTPPPDYVCGCSLPDYLEGVASVRNGTIPGQPLHCYQQASLSQVTMVQFSHNATPYLPDLLLGIVLPTEVSFRTFRNGFNVSQSPSEFELWWGDPENILTDRLFSSPILEGNLYPTLPLQGILDALYFDFPLGYMRMAFKYECYNCSYCAYEKILGLGGFQNIDVLSWALCQGWGGLWNYCETGGTYYVGRCVIYPSYGAPMAFRLKQFFKTFNGMPYTDGVWGLYSPSANGTVDLEPNLLFTNVSYFTENVPVTYGFLEVAKGSVAWLKLLETFPNLENSCSEKITVEVCNGTSICNAFKTSADLGSSSISLSCTDFRHEYETCLQFANGSGNGYRNTTVCPPSFLCRNVPHYSVIYNLEGGDFTTRLMAGKMETTFNDSHASGVCTNTYENVVRHGDELWVTNCTDQGLCHLTGQYHRLNDSSWEREEPKYLSELLPYTNPSYVCYTTTKQKLLPWVISTGGQIFGWLSTFYFVFQQIYSFLSYFRDNSETKADPGVTTTLANDEDQQSESHVKVALLISKTGSDSLHIE